MSGQPTMNIVDDDEMSSQGSVNAPMAAPSTVAQVQAPTRQRYETPSGVASLATLSHGPRDAIACPHRDSRVFSQDAVELHPLFLWLEASVQPSAVAPIVPVDVPSHQETKEAFQEVASAFQDMSTKHGQIQGSLQVLASTVEALKQAQQGEVASSAQVQETLHAGLLLWQATSKQSWVQHLSLKSNHG